MRSSSSIFSLCLQPVNWLLKAELCFVVKENSESKEAYKDYKSCSFELGRKMQGNVGNSWDTGGQWALVWGLHFLSTHNFYFSNIYSNWKIYHM